VSRNSGHVTETSQVAGLNYASESRASSRPPRPECCLLSAVYCLLAAHFVTTIFLTACGLEPVACGSSRTKYTPGANGTRLLLSPYGLMKHRQHGLAQAVIQDEESLAGHFDFNRVVDEAGGVGRPDVIDRPP
jgi:hypothetical protein